MSENISRRKFLGNAGAIAGGVALAGPAMTNMVYGANDKVNIGIIGTGSRGNWLNKLLQKVPDTNVVACCDILPSHLDKGLEIAGKAKGYKEYQALLDDKKVDAVVIATPLSLHTPMAKAALDAGKHIYLEKTMTYDIPGALELNKMVKDSGLTFQVGYQHRYNPLYHKVNRIISDGNLGTVTHTSATWNRNGDWRRPVPDPELERIINWRMYLEYSGGLMAELSSHQIDIVNYMLGKLPKRITGFGGIDYWKDGRETYDNVYTIFEYEGGIKGEFNCLTTNAHEGFAIKFYGTEATLVIRSEQGHKAYVYIEPKKLRSMEGDVDAVSSATMKSWAKGDPIEVTVENQPDGDEGPTTAALTHFTDCIRGKEKVIANVDFGTTGAIAVHLANKAMRNGTIEKWKPEYNI